MQNWCKRLKLERRAEGRAAGLGGLCLALVAAALVAAAGGSWALTVELCASQDNHVYMIIKTGSGSIGTQVTSVALTGGNANTCTETPGAPGTVLTAVSAGQGSLLPGRMRTAVLSGFSDNTVSCATNFDPNAAGGKGVLTLPGGLRKVSADPALPLGGGETQEPLANVTVASGGVPAAMDLASVSRSPGGCTVSGATMVFPLPSGSTNVSDVDAGEVDNQTVTLDDTQGSQVGSVGASVTNPQTTADGFLLQGNCSNPASCQMIVFVAGQGTATSYGAAATGFTVSPNLEVTSTEANGQNGDFNQEPTPTPTCVGVTGVLRSLPRR
ncbi:MAG: hypothetical protein HY699_11825 [Deltaproteobacteria bacterium]|nr:hypothetical protein [Deltaproteobacteria bacterium]